MAVINILKDGTVVDDLSKVTVPKEIVENLIKIIKSKEKNNEYGKNLIRRCDNGRVMPDESGRL